MPPNFAEMRHVLNIAQVSANPLCLLLPAQAELHLSEVLPFKQSPSFVVLADANILTRLNVQVHSSAKSLKLVTFDADGTLYADGCHMEHDNEMVSTLYQGCHVRFTISYAGANDSWLLRCCWVYTCVRNAGYVLLGAGTASVSDVVSELAVPRSMHAGCLKQHVLSEVNCIMLSTLQSLQLDWIHAASCDIPPVAWAAAAGLRSFGTTQVGHIISLMQSGIDVAIVTAAGYPGQPEKFEERVAGLLAAFRKLRMPTDITDRHAPPALMSL